MHDLYFHPGFRHSALCSVSTYSRIVARRVLAMFDDDNIEEEARATAEAFFVNKMDELADDDNGPDEGEIADDAEELEQSIYDDLRFTGDQVLMLSIAGIYHLWERLVKQFLECQFSDNSTRAKKIRTYVFNDIVKVLARYGWTIYDADFYHHLDTLHLVANVAKHGDGDSCDKLCRKAPDMFRNAGLNAPPSARNLRLSQDEFNKATASVIKFFKQFPERLSMSA